MKNIEKITKLKLKVDDIDNSIAQLLNQRKKLTSQILNLKLKSGIQLKDKSREYEIIERLKKIYKYEDKTIIEQIYNYIFKDSIKWHKIKFQKENIKNINDALQIRPIIIAGPCSVENKKQIDQISKTLSNYGIKFLRGGTFKPRTSPNSFQGLGDKGVKLLKSAAQKNSMFTVTEVLEINQLERNYDKIDIIQIGTRNMTSYAFLKQIGKITSHDKKPVILKRGFSSTISEFIEAAKYITEEGNPNLILCLRGIRTFEQIASKLRFTPDLASILELKSITNLPVIFDPSHSTGNADFVLDIAKAALILGADGLLIETHNHPEDSLSDAKQAILPSKLFELLSQI